MDCTRITDTQRGAAADALGYEVEDDQIIDAVHQFKGRTTPDLRKYIRVLERRLEGAGGRGVELADELDSARVALAVR